ncbi:hypothetical protein BDF22DRAFT_20859 [Syncephalis plumigaleata]|nr:hypothetical protein BDF22DRAFT_20859 [Syncephalis plumigaleata]
MLMSRLAQNIIESMSLIPVDELDFMTRSELLQLCKDHDINDVEDKSNRELINILTAAAENTADTKPRRARTLSMISIDEDTLKLLELKALPSPPAIPEDNDDEDDDDEDVKYYSDNGGIDEDDNDNDNISEHSNDSDRKDKNAKEDATTSSSSASHEVEEQSSTNLPDKTTAAPEATALPKLYFALREVGSDGDSDSERASNATPSGPVSPVSSYGPASPLVSTYTAALRATGSNEAVHVMQSHGSSSSLPLSQAATAVAVPPSPERKESPRLLQKSDDIALPSLPVDAMSLGSLSLNGRTDSQETIVNDKCERVLTSEEEEIADWLQSHGLSMEQTRQFANEDMLDWEVLQVATMEGLRALGLTVGRSLKLLTAIQERFAIHSRSLSAEHMAEISVAVEASLKLALAAMELPRYSPASSVASTAASTPATTPAPSRTPSVRHSRSMSITRTLSSDNHPRETKTSAARARMAKNARPKTPTSPPPFVTSWSLEEQIKAARKPTVVTPLPSVTSKSRIKPGTVQVAENRASTLRRLSKQKLRSDSNSISESGNKTLNKSKSTGKCSAPYNAATSSMAMTSQVSSNRRNLPLSFLLYTYNRYA